MTALLSGLWRSNKSTQNQAVNRDKPLDLTITAEVNSVVAIAVQERLQDLPAAPASCGHMPDAPDTAPVAYVVETLVAGYG
jgi:hypothetical protein